jgi:eukaryotic-like serine/threonine-protein kinase
MAKISTNSKADLFVHIGLILALSCLLFFGFFYVWLPLRTKHGEAIPVPNLKGKSVEEIDDILSDLDLAYEVTDCTFVASQPPLSVLAQYPKTGSSVKSGRKIYITLRSVAAPITKLPDVLGRSSKSAQDALQSFGILVSKIVKKPDLADNSVLEVQYNGSKIDAGTKISKGSSVVLVVGDGLGDQYIEVPNLIGKSLEEIELILEGSSLNYSIIYEASDKTPGTVIKQNPSYGAGNKIRIGNVIDVWVSGDAPN